MLNLAKALRKLPSNNIRHSHTQFRIDAFGNKIPEHCTVVYDTSANAEKRIPNINNRPSNIVLVGIFAATSAIGCAFFSSPNTTTTTVTAETKPHSRPLQKKA